MNFPEMEIKDPSFWNEEALDRVREALIILVMYRLPKDRLIENRDVPEIQQFIDNAFDGAVKVWKLGPPSRPLFIRHPENRHAVTVIWESQREQVFQGAN